MLERLILRYLSKKGAIALFVGQIVFYAMLAFYILAIADYSLTEGKPIFFTGMIVIFLIWSAICLLFWRKPNEEIEEKVSN